MDDEQILAAMVGEPPPTYREVVLVEYDPEWPNWFARAAEQIRGALGEAVLQLDHVGSTSVPGLAAKPLIDITSSSPTRPTSRRTSRSWRLPVTSSAFASRTGSSTGCSAAPSRP